LSPPLVRLSVHDHGLSKIAGHVTYTNICFYCCYIISEETEYSIESSNPTYKHSLHVQNTRHVLADL